MRIVLGGNEVDACPGLAAHFPSQPYPQYSNSTTSGSSLIQVSFVILFIPVQKLFNARRGLPIWSFVVIIGGGFCRSKVLIYTCRHFCGHQPNRETAILKHVNADLPFQPSSSAWKATLSFFLESLLRFQRSCSLVIAYHVTVDTAATKQLDPPKWLLSPKHIALLRH